KLIRCGLGEDEKRAHARRLNISRRQLSQEEKREIIKDHLRDNPERSARQIADSLGIDHKTVCAVRKEMEDVGEIPHVETIVDTLGRRQPARKTPTYIDNSPGGRSATIKRAKQIRTENSAVSRARRMENLQQIADKGRAGGKAMPVAAFPIGYVDVPWENKVWSEETGTAKNPPYPCMSVEEICELCAGENSPFTDAAVLFFWRKANNVVEALQVIGAWGFCSKSEMIWDKVHIGNGRWVRDRHEVLMICSRGGMPAPVPGDNPESLYSEAKAGHSRKPAWFAEQITRIYPDLPKLELFQRRQSLTKGDVRLKRGSGWKFWGNESGGEG
ncbi:MAG: S-adenosylmethionine-binding protein, partial [Rhodobacteraceae bacterium]|nr:S-adenosylmethionine-binding protein [Paracoccaceae bacterium]